MYAFQTRTSDKDQAICLVSLHFLCILIRSLK